MLCYQRQKHYSSFYAQTFIVRGNADCPRKINNYLAGIMLDAVQYIVRNVVSFLCMTPLSIHNYHIVFSFKGFHISILYTSYVSGLLSKPYCVKKLNKPLNHTVGRYGRHEIKVAYGHHCRRNTMSTRHYGHEKTPVLRTSKRHSMDRWRIMTGSFYYGR